MQGLTAQQWLLLNGISESPASPTLSELAAFMGSTRQNVRTISKALEDLNFIEVRPNETDGRSVRFDLTDAGLEVLKVNAAIGSEVMELLFKGIGVEALSSTAHTLTQLYERASQMPKTQECKERA